MENGGKSLVQVLVSKVGNKGHQDQRIESLVPSSLELGLCTADSSSRVPWKHLREEPLEVQRDLFSPPAVAAGEGKQNNISTSGPMMVNATETGRGSERLHFVTYCGRKISK